MSFCFKKKEMPYDYADHTSSACEFRCIKFLVFGFGMILLNVIVEKGMAGGG